MNHHDNELQRLNLVLDSYLKKKTIPSLSLILNEPVKYTLRKTSEIKLTELDSLILDSEKTNVMSAVYVKYSGDLHIGALLYLSQTDLKPLAEKLLGKSHSLEFDRLAASSISEIGNILTASIANAMHDDIGCKMWSSVPGYAIESLAVLLESVASDLGEQSERLVTSSIEFQGADSGIKIQMLFIQDQTEVRKLVA